MTKGRAILGGITFYLTWACLIAGTWAILWLALVGRVSLLKQ